jgi:hypothetical protein
MVTSATPPFASSTPDQALNIHMKRPPLSPANKVCPPSPSPARSTPYVKRLKNTEISPTQLNFNEGMLVCMSV